MIIIGAAWGNLLINYHTSMPAMMGLILLSGIIINNAILLLHFDVEKMNEGMNKTEAMLESIRLRTRLVVMTSCAVSVGMLPVAMGSAIIVERLAPLGTVAIGGLMVGTFLTLLLLLRMVLNRLPAERGVCSQHIFQKHFEVVGV